MPVEVVLREVEHRAAVGSKSCTPSSWKLESSSTHTSGRLPASIASGQRVEQRRADVACHATVLPARSTSWPVSAVTVVFPLVPAMARTAGS